MFDLTKISVNKLAKDPMMICVICDKKFTPRHTGQITCAGVECRHERMLRKRSVAAKRRRRHKLLQTLKPRTCIVCGEKFIPDVSKRNWQKTVICGLRCAKLRKNYQAREAHKLRPKQRTDWNKTHANEHIKSTRDSRRAVRRKQELDAIVRVLSGRTGKTDV